MRGQRTRWAILALGISLALPAGFAGRSSGITKKSASTPETANITQPDKTIVPSNRVIHSTNTINEKMFKTTMARVNGESVAITVEESTGKEIKIYQRKDIAVTQPEVKIKSGDQVAYSTENNEDFQRLIKRYQKQMEKPIETRKSDIEVGEDGVSLDDINKYSDPAETLDRQGIPVERAASGAAEN